MSRPPRLDYANARHHVINRGARHAPIFLDDEDCIAFLGLLQDLPARYGVDVVAYALMGNHYHLLLISRRGRLAVAMQHLQSEYARHFNHRHGFDGPMFRGRYVNRLVEDEAWWAHLLAYVHLNPVKAHLVGDPAEAFWTSHAVYLGRVPRPEWLSTGEMLEIFGGREALDAYVREVQVGRERGPEGFDPEDWEGAIPGASGLSPAPEEPGAPVSAERALAEVCAVTGVSVADLGRARLGRQGAPLRWVALAWLVARAGESQAAAGRRLGVHPVLVSRALAQVRSLEGGDSQVARWMRALRGEGERVNG